MDYRAATEPQLVQKRYVPLWGNVPELKFDLKRNERAKFFLLPQLGTGAKATYNIFLKFILKSLVDCFVFCFLLWVFWGGGEAFG